VKTKHLARLAVALPPPARPPALTAVVPAAHPTRVRGGWQGAVAGVRLCQGAVTGGGGQARTDDRRRRGWPVSVPWVSGAETTAQPYAPPSRGDAGDSRTRSLWRGSISCWSAWGGEGRYVKACHGGATNVVTWTGVRGGCWGVVGLRARWSDGGGHACPRWAAAKVRGRRCRCPPRTSRAPRPATRKSEPRRAYVVTTGPVAAAHPPPMPASATVRARRRHRPGRAVVRLAQRCRPL